MLVNNKNTFPRKIVTLYFFIASLSVNSTQVIEIESSSTTSLLNADKNLPKSNMIEQMVTSNGGWLELEHLEVNINFIISDL